MIRSGANARPEALEKLLRSLIELYMVPADIIAVRLFSVEQLLVEFHGANQGDLGARSGHGLQDEALPAKHRHIAVPNIHGADGKDGLANRAQVLRPTRSFPARQLHSARREQHARGTRRLQRP